MRSVINYLFLLTVFCIVQSAVGKESGIGVAVIDQGGAHEVCALLESKLLAGDGDWRLFSREGQALAGTIAEKRLQPLIAKGDWNALKDIQRVDVLVLTGKNEEGRTWARIISIPNGTVLTETWFDPDRAGADLQAGYLESLIERDRYRIGAGNRQLVKLSVGSLVGAKGDVMLRMVESPLHSRLLHRLANDPNILLNERRRVDNVVWERSLDANIETAPETAQIALSGSLERQGFKLVARMVLMLSGGQSRKQVFKADLQMRDNSELRYGEPVLSAQEGRNLDKLSDEIAEWVLARISHRISSREREECCQCGSNRPSGGAAVSTYCNLPLGRFGPQWWCYPRSQQEFGEKFGLASCVRKANGGDEAFSAVEESEYYARQADFLVRCGMASQGAAAADAAWALGKRSPELLQTRIMGHALLAFPYWKSLQRWDHLRPKQSGRYSPGYKWIPLEREPWRLGEAIRTAELLRRYLYLYKDTKPESYDDDPRILGTRALFNASCVLLAACERGWNRDRVHVGQVEELRSLIADSAEELLRMPITTRSAPLYHYMMPFVPLWTESIEKRIEIWDLYLEATQEIAGQHTWLRCVRGTAFGSVLDLWHRRPQSAGRDSSVRERIEAKGNIAGMVFPWEDNALERRRRLLRKIVEMTRSPNFSLQAKGWTLWLLWWDNERDIRGEAPFQSSRSERKARFDADFPDLDYVEEARRAWGAPADCDFSKWIKRKQRAFADRLKTCLTEVFPIEKRLLAGVPIVPDEKISFYPWYLRERLLLDWIKETVEKPAFRPKMPCDAVYIPPKSAKSLPPLCAEMRYPSGMVEFGGYLVDENAVYAVHHGKKGSISRLDLSANRLCKVNIPRSVQSQVDMVEHRRFARTGWQVKQNAKILISERVSFLVGEHRFAYKLKEDGEWRLKKSPGGLPQIVNDRLYFLASGGEGDIAVKRKSLRYGALYEFDPWRAKTECIFSTRRFPPQTILDARAPAIPVAVYADPENALHVLATQERKSKWCIYRRQGDGDFELINTIRCPAARSGSVHTCGSKRFLRFGGTASNEPFCYWNSWAQLDGGSVDGLRPLWRDVRFKDKSAFAFASEIPSGTENGPYVERGEFSYRIAPRDMLTHQRRRQASQCRYWIEVFNRKTRRYYIIPLRLKTPAAARGQMFKRGNAPILFATTEGLWIHPPGYGPLYTLIPYEKIKQHGESQ